MHFHCDNVGQTILSNELWDCFCEKKKPKKQQTNRKTNLEVGLAYKHSYYLLFCGKSIIYGKGVILLDK